MIPIAICDDELLHARQTQAAIRRCEAQAVTRCFETPLALLAAVTQQGYAPRVAVLDIRMAGMDGIELAKRLNALVPGCAVIFLTAYLSYAPDVYETRHVYFVLKNELDRRIDSALRAALAEQKAGAMVVTRLDSVAWLLNLRASDIDCTPFALAFCFVTPDDAMLFMDAGRLPAEAAAALGAQGVRVMDYEKLLGTLTGYHHDHTVLVDTAGTNWAIYTALQSNPCFTLAEGCDPVQALKAVKNPTEIENLKAAHAKDGVAMVRFAIWLEAELAAGRTVTEVDVEQILLKLRAAQELNQGASFDTIAAYGANAAMMHYHATPGSCSALQPKGFLLVDSGATYMDGTTDITRTYALGELTENERTYYTYVLKSHIDMAKLQFLAGCTGGNLDIIARAPVWAHGIDYRCGTGHGVGFFGGVHEGPHNLRITNNVVFKPGMLVTDEPGIYEEGEVGIRIENELVCVEREKNQYGQFLGFEAVTYCPIDLAPVRAELLDESEKAWLNAFHQTVYDTLAPRLTAPERAWLAEKTKALA